MERTTFSCSPEVGGGITHLSVIQPPTSSEQGQTRPMLDQYHQLNCTTLVIMTVVTCNSVSINICHQWRRPAVNNTRLLGYSLPCFLVTQSTTWLYFTCVPLATYSFSSSNGNFELRYSLVSKGSSHARSKLRLSLLRNKAAPTLHARKMNTSSFTLIHLHRVPSLSDTLRPPCT